jgi:hypothetical protein
MGKDRNRGLPDLETASRHEWFSLTAGCAETLKLRVHVAAEYTSATRELFVSQANRRARKRTSNAETLAY